MNPKNGPCMEDNSLKGEEFSNTNYLMEHGLGEFAPYLMNRITRRYNSNVEAGLKNTPLTVARLRALAALAVNGTLSVNSVAIYAVAEQSTTSRLLDQMEAEDLVVRRVGEGDGRVREVSITEAGQRAFDAYFPVMLAEQERLLDGLSLAERKILLTLLGQVLRNVRLNDI